MLLRTICFSGVCVSAAGDEGHEWVGKVAPAGGGAVPTPMDAHSGACFSKHSSVNVCGSKSSL